MKSVARSGRSYVMRARANAVAGTRTASIDAALALFSSHYYDEVSLQSIADAAHVTLRTLLRHFGSKEELFVAAASKLNPGIEAMFDAVPAGDIDAIVDMLSTHWDELGDVVVRLQTLEGRIEAVTRVLARGRIVTRQWVARVFGPWLPRRNAADFERRLALFTLATDVNTWKVLRRELGLSAADTRRAVRALIERLI